MVGLGSNVGDRLLHLQCAVQALVRVTTVTARSSVYETPAVGPPQPDYLNAAVRLRARTSPIELLRLLLGIEQDGGRTRSPDTRWGPRTIDLDVLWIAGVALDTEELTVPHPRLAERAFALLPLLDVAPDAVDPRSGARFSPRDEAGVVRTTLRLL